MAQLSRPIETAITGLDNELHYGRVAPKYRLVYAVAAASRVFVTFLEIHPYANGNGHAARFFLTAFLGRYGYWLKSFPIEPRPPDPPYTDLIKAYRSGNREPLEAHILKCIISN